MRIYFIGEREREVYYYKKIYLKTFFFIKYRVAIFLSDCTVFSIYFSSRDLILISYVQFLIHLRNVYLNISSNEHDIRTD